MVQFFTHRRTKNFLSSDKGIYGCNSCQILGQSKYLITKWPIAKAIFSLFCLTLIVFLSFLCLYQGILKFEWLQNRAAKFMESCLATTWWQSRQKSNNAEVCTKNNGFLSVRKNESLVHSAAKWYLYYKMFMLHYITSTWLRLYFEVVLNYVATQNGPGQRLDDVLSVTVCKDACILSLIIVNSKRHRTILRCSY